MMVRRSCAPYQISSSFSDMSSMPLPTTVHSMSVLSPREAIRPVEWIRPRMNPRSSLPCDFSCPALPAATQTALPGADSRASIHRQTPLEPSWAPPFVPRLMLIEMGFFSRSATVSRYSTACTMRVKSLNVARRSSFSSDAAGTEIKTAAMLAFGHTPLLPAAMLATWVACDPSERCDCRSLNVAGNPPASCTLMAASIRGLVNSLP